MRFLAPLFLIFTVSCAHLHELNERHDRPSRAPSSEAGVLRYGDHDANLSMVKQFPPKREESFTRYYFYIELKDKSGSYIDRDLHEFGVKDKKDILPVTVERVLRGRYYVILDSEKNLSMATLDFYVAGFKLKESFKLGLNTAHLKHTKIKKMTAHSTYAKLELQLKDQNGKFVEAPEAPEVIIESDVEVTKLEHMGNGIWQIHLRYPMGNQLFYISVRSYGVEFKNLFRFQYIDQQ
ncbi:MAG: hypothetical protein V4598_16270 [Bdellovibrionota bacterium]